MSTEHADLGPQVRGRTASERARPALPRAIARLSTHQWCVLGLGVAFLAAGVAMRVWVLRSSLGDADSDEAVTGLMAIHFQHGEFQALYWAAPYAGTFEPFVTSLLFWITGPSVIALKAVPMGFTLLAALLLWRTGREYLGTAYGMLEGAVYWVFPAASVLILMKAQVVYASGACFIVLMVLLVRRMIDAPRPIHFLAFGLLAGMGVWATPLTLATVIPLGAVALAYTWRRPLLNLLVVPTALLGALPWLWFGATNDWVTLHQVGTLPTTYLTRVRGCVFQLYPLLLGLRKPLTKEWLISPQVGKAIFVILFVAMIAVPLKRFGRRVLPLIVPVLVFPFIYAISTTSWYWAEPRHGMFIAPLLILLAVSLVPRWLPAQALAFGLLFAMSVSTIAFVRDLGEATPGLATVNPGKLAPVMAAMRDQGLTTCYADYWIAYRIDFESTEDITCAAYWGDRYPPYRSYADANGARTYLFIRDTPTAASFRDRLAELRLGFSEQSFDTVTMFVLDEPRPPDAINQCVTVAWSPEPTCPA